MPSRSFSDSGPIGIYTDFYGDTSEKVYHSQAGLDEFVLGIGGNSGYPGKMGQPGDVGHGMLLRQCHAWSGSQKVDLLPQGTAYGKQRYVGSIHSTANIPPTIADVSGAAWGPEAYRKMKPTKPEFSGLNSLYELRELTSMLRQRFTPDLMGASSFWLALQFGWKPLLNDVRKLCSLQQHAQKRLAQLLRDNGRPVRRHVNIVDQTSEPTITDGSSLSYQLDMAPNFADYWYAGSTHKHVKIYTHDRVWASARFRFWLPGGPRDINWRRRMLARLYGLTPTPSVVYNAVPWSWLLDWFTNTGDLIENLEVGVADRLAADSFYMMRETSRIVEKDVNCRMFRYPDRQTIAVNVRSGTTQTIKWRGKGDPFGWSTNANTLSGMQVSILGALGMSRLR